jgi:DNA-binding NarL/FixJ family response regulator
MSTNASRISLIIVDDQEVVLAGLRAFFGQVDHIAVVGEARDGLQALDLIRELDPDVALVDLEMPVMSGQRLIEELCGTGTRTASVVLSFHDGPERMLTLKRAGARGYVSKSADASKIVDAVERVARGEMYFPSRLPSDLSDLTETEKQIAIFVAKGFKRADIARLRGIVECTVDTHLLRIREKWKVTSLVEIADLARKIGLLDQGQ